MLSPALMTFVRMRVSGITLLEQGLVRSKPGYRDYMRRDRNDIYEKHPLLAGGAPMGEVLAFESANHPAKIRRWRAFVKLTIGKLQTNRQVADNEAVAGHARTRFLELGAPVRSTSRQSLY